MTANWERDSLMFALRDPQPIAQNLRVERNSLIIQHSVSINACTAHSLSTYFLPTSNATLGTYLGQANVERVPTLTTLTASYGAALML